MDAIEDTHSFDAQRSLRVAVVPLGGVADDVFKRYFSLLRKTTEFPMGNLSKPGTWKKEKCPFKYFSWFDGSLMLEFVDRSRSTKNSEWEDFQVRRGCALQS